MCLGFFIDFAFCPTLRWARVQRNDGHHAPSAMLAMPGWLGLVGHGATFRGRHLNRPGIGHAI
jgi:hypothetical protein